MLYIRVHLGLSFATKRIGPPCCTFATFVTCYSLRIILSQNYLLLVISGLAVIPCPKSLVNTFCSSLGSTLLLIKNTTIDPLHLWVIMHWLEKSNADITLGHMGVDASILCKGVIVSSNNLENLLYWWSEYRRIYGHSETFRLREILEGH